MTRRQPSKNKSLTLLALGVAVTLIAAAAPLAGFRGKIIFRDAKAQASRCRRRAGGTVRPTPAGGPSNLAISKHGAKAKDVQQVVQSWLGYVNPTSGFTGDSCYQGGCGNPAHRGGCAGMEESKLDV